LEVRIISAYAIEANNIALVKNKKQILNVGHFYLNYGEVMALIGENGSGKSTLVQVLALLQKPDSGELFIRGEKVTNKKELDFRRKMAVVFQEALLLNTTVYNNVASGLLIRGYKKSAIDDRVHKWLKIFGIESLAHRSIRFLSGGESQRASLARAFALNPEVLFMDEPFPALDYPTRRSLILELGDILRSTKISTIIVTHDHNEIPPLANSVTVLHQGSIIQRGVYQEIFSRPANNTVAALVGSAIN